MYDIRIECAKGEDVPISIELTDEDSGTATNITGWEVTYRVYELRSESTVFELSTDDDTIVLADHVLDTPDPTLGIISFVITYDLTDRCCFGEYGHELRVVDAEGYRTQLFDGKFVVDEGPRR